MGPESFQKAFLELAPVDRAVTGWVVSPFPGVGVEKPDVKKLVVHGMRHRRRRLFEVDEDAAIRVARVLAKHELGGFGGGVCESGSDKEAVAIGSRGHWEEAPVGGVVALGVQAVDKADLDLGFVWTLPSVDQQIAELDDNATTLARCPRRRWR